MHSAIVELFIFIEGRLFDGLRGLQIIFHANAFIVASNIIVIVGYFKGDGTGHVAETIRDDV